jgi:hypothetical protein
VPVVQLNHRVLYVIGGALVVMVLAELVALCAQGTQGSRLMVSTTTGGMWAGVRAGHVKRGSSRMARA